MNADTTHASDSPASQYDAIFDALSNDRCRIALYRLVEADVPLSLADLSKELAAGEDHVGTEPNEATVESHYVALYHSCVPKLVDAGLVVHDPETDIIELADDRIDLEGCLATARQQERPT